MRRAALICMLLLVPLDARAQLSSGGYWEQAELRPNGGVRLWSAATFRGMTADISSAAIAGSLSLPVNSMLFGMHAGALHGRDGVTSAGATLNAAYRTGSNVLALRAGAAAVPGDGRDVSVTTIGATFARSRVTLSLNSSLVPGTGARMRDSLFVERDTIFTISYLQPATPRRMYTDAEIRYAGAHARLSYEAVLGQRIGRDGDRPSWARVGASYALTNMFALGASYGREPGAAWLNARPRTVGTLYIQVDPPVWTTHAAVVVPAVSGAPLRISSAAGTTSFTIAAPSASSVEIAGTFTSWSSLSLERSADGSWTTTLSLAPGIYQVMLRVDGGGWRTPPGVATLPDGLGGETGVFEVMPPQPQLDDGCA